MLSLNNSLNQIIKKYLVISFASGKTKYNNHYQVGGVRSWKSWQNVGNY